MTKQTKKQHIRAGLCFLSVFVCALFVFLPFIALAQTQGAPIEYAPLSSITPSETIDTTDPGTYLNQMFLILVGVAAILAVIVLIICGFQYMMSDAVTSKESAKKLCWSAVIGLFILLISWVALQVINPDFVQITFDQIRQSISQNGPGSGGAQGPSAFCYSSPTQETQTSFSSKEECDAALEAEQVELQQQLSDVENEIAILTAQESQQCSNCPSGEGFCYVKCLTPTCEISDGSGEWSEPLKSFGACTIAINNASQEKVKKEEEKKQIINKLNALSSSKTSCTSNC